VIEILTVCTGNICRSPLAAQMLATRLADLAPRIHSAGTRARDGHAMTPEAADLARSVGVGADASAAHRSRFLTEAHLGTPDLILAMDRTHRRAVAELAPGRTRVAFTVREFARLAAATPDEAIRQAAAGGTASERLRAALGVIAGQRGLVLPPADLADDDVVDPYRRSAATYARSLAELTPGIEAAERVIRLAIT
jgi:protein-tyrosine phosphatase